MLMVFVVLVFDAVVLAHFLYVTKYVAKKNENVWQNEEEKT